MGKYNIMKKWEYKVLRAYINEEKALEKILNDFGSDDWELVNMRTFEYQNYQNIIKDIDIGYEFVFKRKIKEEKNNNILNG